MPEHVWQNSGREISRGYWDKIVQKVIVRMGSKLFLPMPVRDFFIACKSVKYIWKGICTLGKGKIEVSVLDGTAIVFPIETFHHADQKGFEIISRYFLGVMPFNLLNVLVK